MIFIPLDHHLAYDLLLLQYGFHTYSLQRTIHMMVHVSSQLDSVATCFSRDNIYATDITFKHTIKT
jgi:hypothetical protein